MRNSAENTISTALPLDPALTVVVEDFDTFLVHHAEWPRHTAIPQDDPDP